VRIVIYCEIGNERFQYFCKPKFSKLGNCIWNCSER